MVLDNVAWGIYNRKMRVIPEPVEFVWDEGNQDKNWEKHKVTNDEAEQVFEDEKNVIYRDLFHSQTEERYIILGETSKKRLLYIVFTTRRGKIRIISARDINRKERKLYEETT